MSFVQTGYGIFSKLEKIVNKRSFRVTFVALFSLLLFFGVMNVYAQDEAESPKIQVDYKGIKAFYNLTSGTDKDEDNMNSFSGVSIGNAASVAISTIAPDITVGSGKLDDSVPADMRGGLLGAADSYVNYAYINQPNVNVLAHLGKEWVPGYDKTDTGLYAASQTGYQELMDSGISTIWAKFRDLAYLFFVVVMIVIGFMIMFRSKLGGQTLVSIGNTIPSVIIGLILVTFSFAIAGLIIDMGGLVTNFLATLFQGQLTSIDKIGPLMKTIFVNNGSGSLQGFTAGLTTWGVGNAMAGIGTAAAAGAASGILAIIGPVVAGLGIIAMLLVLVILGIVFVGVVKLLITLYKAYFGILIGVAIAPLQILIGSLPGQKHMITNWFLGLLRNVLVFPVVFFIVNVPQLLNKSEGAIILSLPEKLTHAGVADDATNLTANSGILMFILKIAVIYLAAQAPKYIEGILPPNSSKAMGDAGAAAKMSLSKIPLVGGLFK